MIIRSQDKNQIININHVATISNEYNATSDSCGIYAEFPVNDGWRILLGTYPNQQRALKILDGIRDAVGYGNPFYEMPEE